MVSNIVIAQTTKPESTIPIRRLVAIVILEKLANHPKTERIL